MSRETNQILGHGEENDGIEEYDNPLPDWWLGLFVFCIIWGIGYAIDYHFISHRSQTQSYDAEMIAAEKLWPSNRPGVVSAPTPEMIATGSKIFADTCVACHGKELKGGIGPDLTDATWIHGGSLEDIMNTITTGVPGKTMPTWGPLLGPEKIRNVAAFVYSKGPQLGLHMSDVPRPAPMAPAPAPAPATPTDVPAPAGTPVAPAGTPVAPTGTPVAPAGTPIAPPTAPVPMTP